MINMATRRQRRQKQVHLTLWGRTASTTTSDVSTATRLTDMCSSSCSAGQEWSGSACVTCSSGWNSAGGWNSAAHRERLRVSRCPSSPSTSVQFVLLSRQLNSSRFCVPAHPFLDSLTDAHAHCDGVRRLVREHRDAREWLDWSPWKSDNGCRKSLQLLHAWRIIDHSKILWLFVHIINPSKGLCARLCFNANSLWSSLQENDSWLVDTSTKHASVVHLYVGYHWVHPPMVLPTPLV